MMLRFVNRSAAATLVLALAASCKDSGGPEKLGPPASLTLSSATIPTAPANTPLTTALQITVKDAAGHALPNTEVTFAVTAGGGSLASFKDTTDASGQVTLPAWTLGKSAEPQKVTATATGSSSPVTVDVNATVQTKYNIVVRFYGTPMSASQQALFTKAAQRLMGIITGDVIDASAQGQNIDLATSCNISGQPPFNELVDDIIIYASIQAIDGPGKILAQSGPCLQRDQGTNAKGDTLWMPAVGKMEFDQADLTTITAGGSLQDVITHEMLHVLGFGVFWADEELLSDTATADPRYTGEQARLGCVAMGGTSTCAQSVPVESGGGEGTRLSHWRENSFNNELMTGFINSTQNPLSRMTIGSMADIGYVVNNADFDAYSIPGGALRAAGSSAPNIVSTGWERPAPGTGVWVLSNGKLHRRERR
jgi:hypothetical protein